jgi:hypothetical protein
MTSLTAILFSKFEVGGRPVDVLLVVEQSSEVLSGKISSMPCPQLYARFQLPASFHVNGKAPVL